LTFTFKSFGLSAYSQNGYTKFKILVPVTAGLKYHVPEGFWRKLVLLCVNEAVQKLHFSSHRSSVNLHETSQLYSKVE